MSEPGQVEGGSDEAPGWWGRNRQAVVRVTALAVLWGTGTVLIWPSSSPLQGTTVLSAIFDDVWVLGTTRAIMLGAALYLVASIVAKVWQAAWLRSIGSTTTEPVSDSMEVIQAQVAKLEAEVLESNKVIKDLTNRVTPPS